MVREEMVLGLKKRKLGDMSRAVIIVKNHKTGSLIHFLALVTLFVIILQGTRKQRLWWRMPQASQ